MFVIAIYTDSTLYICGHVYELSLNQILQAQLQSFISSHHQSNVSRKFSYDYHLVKKVKGRVWGLFGTAACRPNVPLPPSEFPSFISRGATHHLGTRDLCQRRRELYKEFCQYIIIHGSTRFFYMPQRWDMGQILSVPLRRKACGGFFRCPKNLTSAGFEPANSGSMLATRPPKPSPPCYFMFRNISFHQSLHNFSVYYHVSSWGLKVSLILLTPQKSAHLHSCCYQLWETNMLGMGSPPMAEC